MPYHATYEFQTHDIVQIGGHLTATFTDYEELFRWLKRELTLLSDGSISVRVMVQNKQIHKTLRISFSGTPQEADNFSEALASQRFISRLATSRDEFDEVFDKQFEHIGLVPNHVYSAAGTDIVTDYVLLTSLDELATNLAMQNIDFCYQINLGLISDTHEVNRSLRKSFVQLEEKSVVPSLLLKQQQRFLKQASQASWLGEEYVACDHDKHFAYVSDLIAECFASENNQYGFPALSVVKNEIVEEQFYCGLLGRYFEPVSLFEEASQIVRTKHLPKALELSLPNINDLENKPLPEAVSSSGKCDVFLSHSSKDHLTTKAVCHYLESQGIRCWMAPRDIAPGSLWSQAIMQGIKESKATVLVFSSDANISRYVLREIEHSVSLNMPVLPLRLEDIPISDSLGFFISSHHWFDVVNERLESKLPQLKDALLPYIQADKSSTY